MTLAINDYSLIGGVWCTLNCNFTMIGYLLYIGSNNGTASELQICRPSNIPNVT